MTTPEIRLGEDAQSKDQPRTWQTPRPDEASPVGSNPADHPNHTGKDALGGASRTEPPAGEAEQIYQASQDAHLHYGRDAAVAVIDKLVRERDEALSNSAELERTFDLQWDADQRAIKQWQDAHPGNDLVWPDRCNMVVWLLDKLDAATATLEDEEAGALESADLIARWREKIAGLEGNLAKARAEVERLRASSPSTRITDAEVEMRAYVEAYGEKAPLEMQYLQRALSILDEERKLKCPPTTSN